LKFMLEHGDFGQLSVVKSGVAHGVTVALGSIRTGFVLLMMIAQMGSLKEGL